MHWFDTMRKTNLGDMELIEAILFTDLPCDLDTGDLRKGYRGVYDDATNRANQLLSDRSRRGIVVVSWSI